jgi:hypothetical protein
MEMTNHQVSLESIFKIIIKMPDLIIGRKKIRKRKTGWLNKFWEESSFY